MPCVSRMEMRKRRISSRNSGKGKVAVRAEPALELEISNK